MTTPPNPLPCGCRADRIEVIDCESGNVVHQQHTVVHCKLHAVAPKLLAMLREVLADSQSFRIGRDTRDRARALLTEAEGRT